MPPTPEPAVAAVLDGYPPLVRERLLAVRALIFRTAEDTGAGPLTETLKWGEPAYLTEASRSGSTIRLGWKASLPDRCALYFNCQTDLVDRFRAQFADELSCEGNRAVVFDATRETPLAALEVCIAAALTYHRDKRAARSKSKAG